MERKAGLSFSNFSWQSKKISAKESCLYGIICFFGNKKCRIYAAYGVLQTPKFIKRMKSIMLSQQMHKFMYVIQNSMIVWEK